MQYSVRASSQVHSAHPSLTQHNTFIGSTVWVTCITSTAPLRAPPPPLLPVNPIPNSLARFTEAYGGAVQWPSSPCSSPPR